MPISKDRFEAMDDEGDRPTPGTNAAKILQFLRTHPDKAFTQSEITDGTGVTPGSVGPTLVRLREAGRVDHRGTYWCISDQERTMDGATGHTSTSMTADEGPDDTPTLDDWQ